MKRDLDLIKELMLAFEKMPPGEVAQTLQMEVEYDAVEVLEHVALLVQAGLLEGECHPDPSMEGGGFFAIHRVTWSGHDFLDAVRNDSVWNATKERLKKVGSWTFDLVVELCKDEVKRRIGGFLTSG
jgi:hypothetical protein